MKITSQLTDDAVLAEIGARIAHRRIDLQLTQGAVAEQAGIGKRTLERMEAGKAAQLDTLLRVLRVLDAMAGLENLIPESGPRPMDLLKRKSQRRQRASRARGPVKRTVEGAVAEGEPWRWGDDT